MTARVPVHASTIVLLVADAALLRLCLHRRPDQQDPFGRWTRSLGALGAALSVIAIAWQGLPALLV